MPAAHAFTISALVNPLILNITAAELLGSGSSSRSISQGSRSASVTGSAVDLTMSPASVGIAGQVTKVYNQGLFDVQFGNGETLCANGAALSAFGSVKDQNNVAGRLNNGTSTVSMTFVPSRLSVSCRGNGSLLRVSYGGTFTLSGFNEATAAGSYSGTITINVSLP